MLMKSHGLNLHKALAAHASALTYSYCCFESCAPSVRHNSRTPLPHPHFSATFHPAHQLPEGRRAASASQSHTQALTFCFHTVRESCIRQRTSRNGNKETQNPRCKDPNITNDGRMHPKDALFQTCLPSNDQILLPGLPPLAILPFAAVF